MASRSSRLFVVLLHLVGVSTNLPRKLWDWTSKSPIVGAHPVAILLERLELESADGLDGLLRRLNGIGYDVEGLLEEPYWLQDDADGKCMGPGGFSECGDATLWLVRRRPAKGRRQGRKKKNKGKKGVVSSLLGRSKGDDEDMVWTYALQLIDANLPSSSSSLPASDLPRENKSRRRNAASGGQEAECLVASSSRKRHRRGNNLKEEKNMWLVPCGSDEAWGWHVDGDGVLLVSSDDGGGVVPAGFREKRGSALMGVHGKVDPTSKGRKNGLSREGASYRCLRRIMSTSEVAPCPDEERKGRSPQLANATNATINDRGQQSRAVRFSVIRYQAGGAGSSARAKLPKFTPVMSDDDIGRGRSSPVEGGDDDEASRTRTAKREGAYPVFTAPPPPTKRARQDRGIGGGGGGSGSGSNGLPHTARTSRSHASEPLMHPDLKPSSQLLFTNVGTNPAKKKSAAAATEGKKRNSLPTGTSAQDRMRPGGGSSQPSLSAGGGGPGGSSALPRKSGGSSKDGSASGTKTPDVTNKNLLHKQKQPPNKNKAASSSPKLHQDDDSADVPLAKPRKIPVHPYIANVKSPGVWEDPQTKLEYLTDLSGYLGHDRREKGRHTLMGVGLYTRTVFNIKVYGCAFYATKRDVLADPSYAPFAAMDASDLRSRDDFYDLLMSESSRVDRTLFLQMNMQLATETMRTSLDADWSLMTPEHKSLLISSSFRERNADERMLRRIKSKENSSRCSCGQKAPPEYEADPECCARGTELVFTWKKDGTLELRIDGRIMDAFDDPGIGRAIFYEYLRGDDPMSMDARDHFADGFPFLLAPLAQVKGVSSAPLHPQEGSGSNEALGAGVGPLGFVRHMANSVGSQAAGAAGWVQSGASEAMGNMAKAARAAGDSARNLGAEMDRRRSEMVGHILSAPEQSAQFLSSLLPFKKARQRQKKVFQLRVLKSDGSTAGWDTGVGNRSLQNILGGPIATTTQGSVGQNTASAGGGNAPDSSSQHHPLSDEIGVIKSPTMNFTHQLFLYSVHLYLMLLLIVSAPGSYATKLVVKRAASGSSSSGSGRGDDDESADSVLCASPVEARRRSSLKSSRSSRSRLRGMEVAVQLQLPSLQGSSGQGTKKKAVAADKEDFGSGGGQEVGRQRRDSLNPQAPEQKSEMKKAFSYFL